MKDAKITIRLFADDKEKLKLLAEKDGIAVSEIIRELIEKYLADKGEE